MAVFRANVKVDMTGNSGGGNVTYIDRYSNAIEFGFKGGYEVLRGDFDYYGKVPYGYVYTDVTYNNYGEILVTWNADGAYYRSEDIYNMVAKGQTKQLFKYMFYLNDDIRGSLGNDKLKGYNGDDFIDGWRGNDKLWGGPGRDIFFFARGDGKDVIKDFARKKDTIFLEDDLAWNYRDVKDAAEKYKKGVVLDFGSNSQIKIEGLKMKQLKKVDFDFVDFVV